MAKQTALTRTILRDIRRDPSLAGEDEKFMALHGGGSDFNEKTDYGYTIGEMLWDHHKYLYRGGTDEADGTNMLDRIAYHRKCKQSA